MVEMKKSINRTNMFTTSLAKRLLAAFMALTMMAVFVACAKTEPAPAVSDSTPAPAAVRVAALNGPSGVSVTKLAYDAKTSGAYEMTFAGSPDQLVGLITTGEVDVACVPTNLAAVLYAKTGGDIRVCAATTLGVLYLLDTTGKINEIADLAGKSIEATGQGSNPEYILNYILEKNGLKPGEDVTVDYRAEHAELATRMLSGDAKTAMLPVPFATQVQMKLENVKMIDLQAEWNKISDTEVAQTVIVTNADFAANHSDRLDAFLADLSASTDFVLSDAKTAAAYVEELGILPSAALAEKAIPYCNLTYVDGERMKALVSDFLEVLYNADAKSVGGSLPNEDFYYIAK